MIHKNKNQILPEYEAFYTMNHKSNHAGYDKWVLLKNQNCINPGFANYVNKRTSRVKLFAIKNNKPVSYSYSKIFWSVVEYFVYSENSEKSCTDKQYQFELNNIRKKYPEYFI